MINKKSETGTTSCQGWILLGSGDQEEEAPWLSSSMGNDLEGLKIDRLVVIYHGNGHYLLAEQAEVIHFAELAEIIYV
jgi:hypothetical protein